MKVNYVSYDKKGYAKYHRTLLGAKIRAKLKGTSVDVHWKNKRGKDNYGSLDYYNTCKKSKLFNS